jgi:hypothetical protein
MQSGIIVKLIKPQADCTYLIVPLAFAIIARIVLSMGLYREVNGLYQIVWAHSARVVSHEFQGVYFADDDYGDMQVAALFSNELESNALVSVGRGRTCIGHIGCSSRVCCSCPWQP